MGDKFWIVNYDMDLEYIGKFTSYASAEEWLEEEGKSSFYLLFTIETFNKWKEFFNE